MPHGSMTAVIQAPSTKVFLLFHDYDKRLEWDTLLRAAYLTDGWKTAQLHATSVCVGRVGLGGFAVKTRYISFKPPFVAAIQLVNHPPFFETFAATIRHRDLENGKSEIEYLYSFRARPKWLRWLLHPLMSLIFRYETRKRLEALAAFFAPVSHTYA